MQTELMEHESHTYDESALILRALQQDLPQVPMSDPIMSRWIKIFRLSRSSPKVPKGKEREQLSENGIIHPAAVPIPEPSITLRTSQQQPQDLQHIQAVPDQDERTSSSPRELLYAALQKPVLYQSGFSVLRTVSAPRDQNHQQFYDQNNGVQQQVIATLKEVLGIAAACKSRVEYVMGRVDDRAELKPTILICCSDGKQRSKVYNRFRTQPWTMAGYSYSVEVDPVVLASGSVDREPLRGDGVRADVRDLETLCGLACEVYAEKDNADDSSLDLANPLARLTLGGLICVNNRNLYALTTAHSFIESPHSDNTSRNTENSYYEFFGRIHQFEYLDHLACPDSAEKLPRTNWAWDWALLQVDQLAHYKPNSFQPQLSGTPRVFIESYMTGEQLSDGEVWVCSASKGPRLAMLYADRTLIADGNSTFEARSIGLAEELADGDSGSWVIRDGKLCGYIFSRILHRPWAYMLPIGSVLQEISRVLSHTPDESVSVEVATRAEIERARHPELIPRDEKYLSTDFSTTGFDSDYFSASGSDHPKNQRELSKDTKGAKDLSKLFSSAYSKIDSLSASEHSERKVVSAGGSDYPKSERELSKDINVNKDLPRFPSPADSRITSVSPFKPPRRKRVPTSGSDHSKNELKLPKDAKRERDTEPMFSSILDLVKKTSKLVSVSPWAENGTDRVTMARIANETGMDFIFPRLIRDYVASIDTHHIFTMIEAPNLPEIVSLQFQRVNMQNSIFRDSMQNLVTTYGDARVLSLLKDSSDGMALSSAAEVVMEKLVRTLGMGKTKLVFEKLASIDSRLRSLHSKATPLVRTSLVTSELHKFIQSISTSRQIYEIDGLLRELERINSQLRILLLVPTPRLRVQDMSIRYKLSLRELQLELYRVLSLVSAEPIESVVLRLPYSYSIVEDLPNILQDCGKRLLFLCRPHGMYDGLENQLNCRVSKLKNIPWKHPQSVWARQILELNRGSWWHCKMDQTNDFVGVVDRVDNINLFAHELSTLRTPVHFGGNAHHMVFNKSKVQDEFCNMAQFFEDERQKKSLSPMKLSSSRFISLALKLSSLILSLSSTPWVDVDWTWDNILVTRVSENLDAEPEVFIAQKLRSADEKLEQLLSQASSSSNTRDLREPILQRLGFALTELAFRKRFDVPDDMIMYEVVMDLLDAGQIAMMEGPIYGDVVKACLTHSYHSGPETKTIDSRRPDFQDAVYEAILTPLHDLWSNAQDRKLSVVPKPPISEVM